MPEGYTHIRTARKAAELARMQIDHQKAFEAGANGPDILFSYRVWRTAQNRGENLPLIGDRLHNENTGEFLKTILSSAKTPTERSYVLGFLCHYATDCVVHPYVVHVSGKGQLYGGPGGHGYFEIALDSFLHKQDTRSGAVGVNANTPKLCGAALAGAGALLQKGIAAALGIQVSREALADTFWHTRSMRRLFVSRLKLSYGVFWLVEPLFGGRGFITGHVSPARLKGVSPKAKKKLPTQWRHPFSGELMDKDVFALLEDAARLSAGYMLAADGYWKGEVSLKKLMGFLGSNSYLSGMADVKSTSAHWQSMHPAADQAWI